MQGVLYVSTWLFWVFRTAFHGRFLPRKPEAAEVTVEAGIWIKLDAFSFGFVSLGWEIASERRVVPPSEGAGSLDQGSHRSVVGQQGRRSHRWGDGISGVPFQVKLVPAGGTGRLLEHCSRGSSPRDFARDAVPGGGGRQTTNGGLILADPAVRDGRRRGPHNLVGGIYGVRRCNKKIRKS